MTAFIRTPPRFQNAPRSLFAALLLAAAPLAAAQKPQLDDADMIQRLAACAACHGERGEGAPGAEYYPHLAAKPAGYLFAQMQGFRDGRRHYPQMVYLMRNWDDAWLARIAVFYAEQALVPPTHAASTPLQGQALARARQLVHDGDPASGQPACAACHGPTLAGMEPGIPALAGLPTDYLIAQLGGWLTGARHSLAPDCMAEVVGHLRDGDIRLVSTYLSGLPVAAEDRPAPAESWPLPLACGGTGHFDPQTGVTP